MLHFRRKKIKKLHFSIYDKSLLKFYWQAFIIYVCLTIFRENLR